KLLSAVIEHLRTASPPAALGSDARGLARIDAEIEGLFAGLRRNPAWARAYIVIAHEAATSLPELLPAIHEQNTAFRGRIEGAPPSASGAEGTCAQQQAVLAQMVTPRPASTTHPHSAHRISMSHLFFAEDVEVAEGRGTITE